MANKFESISGGSEQQEKQKTTILLSKIYTIQKAFDIKQLSEDDYKDFKDTLRDIVNTYCVVDDKTGNIRIRTELKPNERIDALTKIDGLIKLADSKLGRGKREYWEKIAG